MIKITSTHNLKAVNPTLAKEWHPTKNGTLTPRDVTPNSHKKVWWVCSKNHEWKAEIKSRNISRCPYCSGKTVCEDNCLQTINPLLAKEWHPTKNGTLTPRDVTPSSNKKVWWICKREHEWITGIAHRTNGTGCPYCHSQTSFFELRIYTEIKSLFKHVDHRTKIHGVECDIYIPDFKIAIEVDSLYWHKNKYIIDERKTRLLQDKGIFLLHIRQKGLNKISPTDIVLANNFTDFRLLKEVIGGILQRANLNEEIRKKLKTYLKNKILINDEEFVKLLYMLPSPLPGLSLFDLNPILAKEWHPTKNKSLTSKDVTPNSNIKAWWICSKGHEWQAKINNRNIRGDNCPYCSGKKACEVNCLQTINSILAKEWHLTKNGSLTPKDITPGSNKKVWWICSKGHEWQNNINNRNKGQNCPYCYGLKPTEEHNLFFENPVLSKEWHPTKNNNLTPRDFAPISGKKVWWMCKKGHEWQASISNRNDKGRGCPYCSGFMVARDNCLQTVNLSLAKEWHPTKNGNLTPRDVTSHSGKKVWWQCPKGHEWQATVDSRSRRASCPYCSGRRK